MMAGANMQRAGHFTFEVVDFTMAVFQLLQNGLCATEKDITGRRQDGLPSNAIEQSGVQFRFQSLYAFADSRLGQV